MVRRAWGQWLDGSATRRRRSVPSTTGRIRKNVGTPISDALSTLSDRGLRRLLGARTFLRGLEYFRRRVVEDVNVGETMATGTVRAADTEPFPVSVEITPEGIKSSCECPAFT